ncbi:MAG: VOC family protein [Alphaproteobacteria bacterium]
MAWEERQTPKGDEVFLDHVGWFVVDLDAAAAQLKRLGFVVSAENVHMNRAPDGSTAPSGTVNRLATPDLGYLEFLGSRGDAPLARQHRAQLARYEGLHLLAFSSADVPAEAPRLEAEGFRPLPPVDMRRDVQTEGGVEEGRFSVLRVPPEAMPEGRVQWCAHHTPDLVWQPGRTPHPNGVQALTGALWVVPDLDEAAARYARFLRKPAQPVAPGVVALALERGDLLLATPAAARRLIPALEVPTAPFGAAVALRVGNLDSTAALLRAAGVAHERAGDRLLVPPAEALGAWLLLHEDSEGLAASAG